MKIEFFEVDFYKSIYSFDKNKYWEFNITPQIQIIRENNYFEIEIKFLIFGIDVCLKIK